MVLQGGIRRDFAAQGGVFQRSFPKDLQRLCVLHRLDYTQGENSSLNWDFILAILSDSVGETWHASSKMLRKQLFANTLN